MRRKKKKCIFVSFNSLPYNLFISHSSWNLKHWIIRKMTLTDTIQSTSPYDPSLYLSLFPWFSIPFSFFSFQFLNPPSFKTCSGVRFVWHVFNSPSVHGGGERDEIYGPNVVLCLFVYFFVCFILNLRPLHIAWQWNYLKIKVNAIIYLLVFLWF